MSSLPSHTRDTSVARFRPDRRFHRRRHRHPHRRRPGRTPRRRRPGPDLPTAPTRADGADLRAICGAGGRFSASSSRRPAGAGSCSSSSGRRFPAGAPRCRAARASVPRGPGFPERWPPRRPEEMSRTELREAVFDSPLRARSLFTVRAAISSARASEAPLRRSLSRMCSYCLPRLLDFLTPRGGISTSVRWFPVPPDLPGEGTAENRDRRL